MARPGPVLPGWYLSEQLGVTEPKEATFAAQLVAALEKISPDLAPRVLKHPLVGEIARGADAFPALLARFDAAKDEGDRALALDAIAEILAQQEPTATHDVVVALERILATAKEPRVASVAARALAATRHEPFLEHQRNVLGSKSLDEVRIAARLLGYGRFVPAVPVLMELLRPDNAMIADVVVWALGEIGDEQAVPMIQLWLTRGPLSLEALSALGKIGSRASVVRIVPFLLEGLPEQREKAAEAIARIARANDGSLGDPGLDDTVRKTLEKVVEADESRVTRFHALVAYSLLGGRMEPARILAALGGRLSGSEIDAVGAVLKARPGPKDPAGPRAKKGRRPV